MKRIAALALVLAMAGCATQPSMSQAGRGWAGVWGELNGHTIPERLPEPAEQVLRALSFHRAAGRNPPAHWFTTLADPPRPGVVRAALRRAAAAALEPLGSTMP